MPFEITFNATIEPAASETYINDCCWGGDVIRDRLRPIVEPFGRDLLTTQEDWGWFLWVRHQDLQMCVDIGCWSHGETHGEFVIHMICRRGRWFFTRMRPDIPELEQLKDSVVKDLRRWAENVQVTSYKDEFMTPITE